MAERRGHDRSVQFEHAFDRLLAVKLEQVYRILVPERVRAIGADQSVRGKRDEGSAIYARVSSEQQKEENTIASQTAALIDFAREQGYSVPDDWVIEDEGFSGASLLRPGLERLRDLAAEGHIQTVLIHSPDRLSRKYAYQVLLTEEFARHRVETIFLKAPHSDTPEDQLMLQFQGMIAEYERAQILERSRRGKRHRAKAGQVSVLCAAPYGYRYIRKTSEAPARYEIDAAEAEVVRLVYDKYTVGGLSIGAIARLLHGMGVPTRRRVRWERSVVWAILRNPAYKGTACFNKTQVGPRQKATKPFRLSGRAVHGDKSSSHERPRDEWIEIPVPAIVSAETFALAAERLADNKRFAPRRTIEPSIVQGLVSCRKCGYALSRTSARTSARKIHYYRCLGSDAWRHLGGAVCDSRPIRQDLLDQIVWQEVIHLIEDPTLIRAELDRRLDAARAAEPTKRRQEALERELTRIRKSMERLLTAYQEDLLSLDELRRRMPELRAREQSMQAERQAILDQAADQISFLRLAETLTAFLQRLRQSAETLEIAERQKVVRLLVKEVLVDNDTITIRHSIQAQPPTSPPAARRYRQTANSGSALKVTFCVRGVLSPLLSNLVLDDLDKELARRGHRFCRYADDCNIYVRSRRAGERVMASVSRFLTQKLRLKVNQAKSAVARPEERKFLGFSISNDGSERRIAPKALETFKGRIRDMTSRTRGLSLGQVIGELTPYLVGWRGYFGFCQTPRVLTNLEAWIRRRLRSYLWRQWGNGHNRFKELRRRGVSQFRAAVAAGSPTGFWRMSGHPAVQAALRNHHFDSLGLPRLHVPAAT